MYTQSRTTCQSWESNFKVRQMQGQHPLNKFSGHQSICPQAKIVAVRISPDPLINSMFKPIPLTHCSHREREGYIGKLKEIKKDFICCRCEEINYHQMFGNQINQLAKMQLILWINQCEGMCHSVQLKKINWMYIPLNLCCLQQQMKVLFYQQAPVLLLKLQAFNSRIKNDRKTGFVL